MRTFTATVWDKVEHWTFEAPVGASSHEQAIKLLQKEFPAKHYTVRTDTVREVK